MASERGKKPFATVGTKFQNDETNTVINLRPRSFADRLRKEPVAVAGSVGVVGALTYGLYSFLNGDSAKSQQMMRGRVIFQGVAVGALGAFALYRFWKSEV